MREMTMGKSSLLTLVFFFVLIFAVVNAYKIENGKVVQIEQKLTPGKSAAVAENSLSWRTSIWHDILG